MPRAASASSVNPPPTSGSWSSALSPGARVGSYEILQRLGAGGMGEVYRAKDSRLDREVAIKTPFARPRFASGNLIAFRAGGPFCQCAESPEHRDDLWTRARERHALYRHGIGAWRNGAFAARFWPDFIFVWIVERCLAEVPRQRYASTRARFLADGNSTQPLLSAVSSDSATVHHCKIRDLDIRRAAASTIVCPATLFRLLLPAFAQPFHRDGSHRLA